MRISTRGRYATRAMLELALRHSSAPVNIKDIARAQRVSVKYLENLFITLKKAKLVKSTVGLHGGYVLTRPPRKIKLREIVEVMEGDLAPVECVSNPRVCSRVSKCVIREVWKKVDAAVKKILGATTLQSLVDEYRQKKRSSRGAKKGRTAKLLRGTKRKQKK